MDDCQCHVNLDRLSRVHLDCPNGQRSNGLSMSRQFGPSKWTMVHKTVDHLYGPLDRLYYANLNRQKLQLWPVFLDRPKLWLWTVILDRPTLRSWTIILDRPTLRL